MPFGQPKSLLALAPAALVALLQLACGSSGGSSKPDDPTPTPAAEFESANPNQGSGADGNLAVGSASSTNGGVATDGSGGSGGTGGGDGGEDPGRLIEEADIVKTVGDRLYAMSRYGGVAAIDVSDVD